MNHIEKLIQQLCPDGVEFKPLGEVCEFRRGTMITKKDAVEGDIPVIAGGQKPAYYHNEANRFGETIAVSGSGAYAGFVSYWTIPIFLSDAFSVDPIDKNLNLKFLYYVLKLNQEKIYNTKKGSGVPHVHGSSIAHFPIPLPPLPVQEAIVEVLDKFSQLEAELEAELEARKQQYAYYRERLLNFEGRTDVEWRTLGEVCKSVTSGGTPLSTKPEYYSGNIPWLRTQEVNWNEIYDTEIKITEEGLRNSSAKWIPENCVIVAMYGATAARVAINKIPLTTNQACCNLEVNSSIAYYRFVFHWLSYQYPVLKSLGEGSQANLNAQKIKSFPIPLPPLSEQERIVGILDRFDALVNDLTSGLPAELSARRKQYAYYRDRLLTFRPR